MRVSGRIAQDSPGLPVARGNDFVAAGAAFDAGADYLLEPIAADRLAQTAARLRDRLQAATAAPARDGLVDRLAAQLQQRHTADDARVPLRWVSASGGDGWPESLSIRQQLLNNHV